MFKTKIKKVQSEIYSLILLLAAMSGLIGLNSSIFRFVIMAFSVASTIYITNYQPYNFEFAVYYFLVSEFLYIFSITFLLSENGYRNTMISQYGEEKAYHRYQTIQGFLFFHNGVSMGFIASASPGKLFDFMPVNLFYTLVVSLFCIGLIIKVWSTKVVGTDIYYWKDMFLGRKVREFVSSGPYKFLSNPMYGVGHLHGYALAIWHQSLWGILAFVFNQIMLFTFYHFIEKKFINRIYRLNKV